MNANECFKDCTICGNCWQSREAFLSDPDLTYLGYQAHFEDLSTGLLFFNHDCKTTLALEVSRFRDLYDGPVFSQRKTGTDECPGHCLYRESIDPCPAQCECAFVRELMQIIVSWPKAGNPSELVPAHEKLSCSGAVLRTRRACGVRR